MKSGFLGQLSKKSSHQITLPCDRDLNNELEYYESLNATDVDETMLGQIKRPLNFFKKHCDDLPKLARVARIIMCVPSTSVPSESLFSIAGLIQNDLRNRLAPTSLNMLNFLKFNA